ncbi:unknown protein [Azorhizobium caulinodans ORS 571]|uniref:Uncharacterized protein n=1 Tax=Azorhizobium caulinodans (strain ATCC 43989 / DSM 5975 / JCM 20966 / LMG 6465 / NBRC 14845 / NCIMB 13405 / ORS 571) TaxID=438753 RepID=A8HTP8_AZOC5|nr:hypothetical protein [Azorhizobium caulinodans]BAF86857.1 unknown protein [Azorhizobium caulinodans ORS 571]
MTIVLTILAALARFASTGAGRVVIGLILLVGLVWGANAYGRAAGRAEVRAEWEAANLHAAEEIRRSDQAQADAAGAKDRGLISRLTAEAQTMKEKTDALEAQLAARDGCSTDDAFPDGLPAGWNSGPRAGSAGAAGGVPAR